MEAKYELLYYILEVQIAIVITSETFSLHPGLQWSQFKYPWDASVVMTIILPNVMSCSYYIYKQDPF